MYVRPRPRFRPRNAGGVPFSPALLFTSGVAGAWYDPSDTSTLFQDSAGTTPVTAVEQPVGLMLDKSQGLAGTQQIADPSFDSGIAGWGTQFPGADITFAWNSTLKSMAITRTGAGITGRPTYAISVVAGTWYKITFITNAAGVTNSAAFGVSDAVGATAISGLGPQSVSSQTTVKYGVATTTGTAYVGLWCNQSTSVDILSVEITAVAGNHASQATAASRPVLRARYNLLTYSEQFDNAAWSISGVTRSNNTQTAPDGTVTAETITGSSGTSAILFTTSGYTALAGNLTVSTYIKAGTADYAVLSLWAGSGIIGVNFWVNVQTGAVGSNSVTAGYTFVSGSSTAVGNGWYRVVLTGTVPAGIIYYSLRLVDGDNAFNYTNTVGKTLFVWGADLRTGSSAGTYQRIAAATDYATAGFDPYLAADGVDDFLAAAYVQSAYPLTLAAGINNDSISVTFGAFVSVAQSDSVYKVARDNSVGATDAQDRNAATITVGAIAQAGNKFVLSQFETSLTTQQVNSGTANTIANTNAFGTSANIFLGKARPTNLFSSAKVYGVVITNSVLSAAQVTSLRSWMGGKMGVTL